MCIRDRPKYQRLKPDGEVRLMGAYIVKCTGFEKDEAGNVTKILCTADLEDVYKRQGERRVCLSLFMETVRNCGRSSPSAGSPGTCLLYTSRCV